MKKLILIAIVIVGCKTKQEIQKNIYRNKFNSYVDSCEAYNSKFYCYIKCKKIDSAKYAATKGDSFSDSIKVYYKLLYPNDNQFDKGIDSQPNCNCK